ncbi:hypothetical protein [Streptomyces sp. NBC_01304]|uniref:hypothetical protein n=1 Tax=Streptomyces sp. NBC_01304 TaxID=2903818 RepID=UPI002E133D75|nr:hypothetical protein OG430_33620 [Streptomyces sp. NBC_01304]
MSDLFELQLSLDLPKSLPQDDLNFLRWHLGQVPGEATAGLDSEAYGLLCIREPASRIGGLLLAELSRGPRGWALTARQEIHPDQFDALQTLLEWLATHTTTAGAVGSLRFLEEFVADALVVESGVIRRWSARKPAAAEADLLPGAEM